jgi:hypothetical protein
MLPAPTSRRRRGLGQCNELSSARGDGASVDGERCGGYAGNLSEVYLKMVI